MSEYSYRPTSATETREESEATEAAFVRRRVIALCDDCAKPLLATPLCDGTSVAELTIGGHRWPACDQCGRVFREMEQARHFRGEDMPGCRCCNKPARYIGFTGRAYCSPECGYCPADDRVPWADALDRTVP